MEHDTQIVGIQRIFLKQIFKNPEVLLSKTPGEVEKIIGHRVKLDNLAQMTLGAGKSGDGLQALKFWKLGQIEELKKYCLDDVRITKELYDYVLKYGKLAYKDYFETKEIQVKFAEPAARKPVSRQASLF